MKFEGPSLFLSPLPLLWRRRDSPVLVSTPQTCPSPQSRNGWMLETRKAAVYRFVSLSLWGQYFWEIGHTFLSAFPTCKPINFRNLFHLSDPGKFVNNNTNHSLWLGQLSCCWTKMAATKWLTLPSERRKWLTCLLVWFHLWWAEFKADNLAEVCGRAKLFVLWWPGSRAGEEYQTRRDRDLIYYPRSHLVAQPDPPRSEHY